MSIQAQALYLQKGFGGEAEGGDSTFDGLDLEAKSVELALVFGGGLDIAAGSMTVTFDGRYGPGLTDILEIEGNNRAWELFAEIGFPFGQ